MDSETAVQDDLTLLADSPDWSTRDCYCDLEDDTPEGGVIADERVLADPWSQSSARRAMGFLAHRKIGPRLWAMRIDPLPIGGGGQSLHWLCFCPQREIDGWRAAARHADATLAAVTCWLEEAFLPFGAAVAASFPLGVIQTALLECLDARERDVLQRRMAGETLNSIAEAFKLTRERIRQIESDGMTCLAARIVAMHATQHPATAALFVHTDRLASRVLASASREECILSDETRRRWIRQSLTGPEAGFLEILRRISEDVKPDLKPAFDPLSFAGHPLQGGRTSLPWHDGDVAALREGFARSAGSAMRRRARIDGVCASAGLPRDAVTALARFAGLTPQGNWLLAGPLKVSDARRTMLAEALAASGRPMNEAEILEVLVPLGVGSDSALRDIHRAMSDDRHTFVSDGKASWQLRSDLGSVVGRRAAHPDLPPPMSHPSLAGALASLHLFPGKRDAVLDGLNAGDAGFAFDAGDRLAGALAGLPGDERRSLAQILRPADEATLASWLRLGVPGGGAPRMLEGLTMLAAFVSVIRTVAGSDDPHWAAILESCGEGARRWLFNTGQAPRRRVLSRLVEVAVHFRLRRAFSFHSDPWSSLLTLQAALLRKDIGAMGNWLSTNRPPVALRQLAAAGPNRSASMACTWTVLHAYRRGAVGREAIETLVQRSEWWPGWSVEEVCRVIAGQPPLTVGPPSNEDGLQHPGMPVAA